MYVEIWDPSTTSSSSSQVQFGKPLTTSGEFKLGSDNQSLVGRGGDNSIVF